MEEKRPGNPNKCCGNGLVCIKCKYFNVCYPKDPLRKEFQEELNVLEKKDN